MSKKSLIHFIATGGTIDAEWSGSHDAIVVSETSNLPSYFKKYPLIDEITFTQACMKDSRELTDEDRELIVKTIEESKADKIIVTHGTFTIIDTMRFLKKHLKRTDQTIVFTGATSPLRAFEMSDAALNLGFAIAIAESLNPNMYVAMKGKAFTKEEVEKKIEEGKFHEVFSSSDQP